MSIRVSDIPQRRDASPKQRPVPHAGAGGVHPHRRVRALLLRYVSLMAPASISFFQTFDVLRSICLLAGFVLVSRPRRMARIHTVHDGPRWEVARCRERFCSSHRCWRSGARRWVIWCGRERETLAVLGRLGILYRRGMVLVIIAISGLGRHSVRDSPLTLARALTVVYIVANQIHGEIRTALLW